MQSFEAGLQKVINYSQCTECFEIRSFRFENSVNLEYEAGHFFSIDIPTKEETCQHFFSFSSSPAEEGYLEFTTRIRDSVFKTVLKKLNIGDIAILKAPMGEFTATDNTNEKLGMICGGIGITSFRSLCKYFADKGIAKDIILLYSNHHEPDIIFRKDFDTMQSINPNLKVVYTLSKPDDTWSGYTGRINSQMIAMEIPDYLTRTFYLSGSYGMAQAMEEILIDLQVPKRQIKQEIFPGY